MGVNIAIARFDRSIKFLNKVISTEFKFCQLLKLILATCVYLFHGTSVRYRRSKDKHYRRVSVITHAMVSNPQNEVIKIYITTELTSHKENCAVKMWLTV